MLTKRKEELLKIIVEDYIRTARPVSSKSLTDILNCSSATIRNEMSELEEDGLLEKTHTSSGRIPSQLGYRYYVDNIMKPKEITGDDMLRLQTVFRNKSLVIDDAILRSMEIISELTNYTTIVLGNTSSKNLISKVEVVPISEEKLIAIVITNQGHVEHRNVNIEGHVSSNEIKKTVEIINKLIVGTPISEVSKVLEFEIKPVINKYVEQHEALYSAFYNAFNDFKESSDIKVKGTSNILKQPEFDNAEKIRDIISKFEDKMIVNQIKEEDNGINIYIGSENDFDEDVTVIKTKYSYNGLEGTIALIGPKRMEYDRVISLLDYIKQNIDK